MSSKLAEVKSHMSAAAKKGTRPEWLLNLKSNAIQFSITFTDNPSFKAQNSNYVIVHPDCMDNLPRWKGLTSRVPANVIAEMKGTWTYKVQVMGKWTPPKLRLVEGYADQWKCTIDIPFEDLELQKAGPTGNEDEEGLDFDIIFKLKKPAKAHFEWNSRTVKSFGKYREDVQANALVFSQKTNEGNFVVEVSQYLKIRVKNWTQIRSGQIFQEDVIRELIKAVDPVSGIETWHKQQMAATIAEAEDGDRARAALRRSNFTVSFARVPHLFGRYCVKFQGQNDWNVPAQMTVQLGYSGEGSSPFKEDPGKVANQKSESNFWLGTTFVRNNDLYCIINNPLNSTIREKIEASLDSTFGGVTVTFPDEDTDHLTTRMFEAIHASAATMWRENNAEKDFPQNFKLPKDFEPTSINMKLANFFLPAAPELNVDHNLISRIPATTDFQRDILDNPQFSLRHPSHKEAVRMVFEGRNSRSIIQGPPATGKTTMLAKLVCLIDTYTNLRGCKIVVTAHTNAAVRVACLRTLDLAEQMFDMENTTANICLVTTQNTQTFMKVSAQEMPSRLQAASIWAHMDRYAVGDKFSIFRRGRASFEKTGQFYPDIAQDGKDYTAQKKELIDMVKERATIFFTTMSTINNKDPVFGGEGLDIEMLFADEMSQATDAAIAGVLAFGNPRAFVGLGDHKQLAPHTKTDIAKNTWGISLLERMYDSSKTRSVRLNEQYRTNSRIYAGTNAHYNASVATPSDNDTRDGGIATLSKIKRASFRDAKGTVHKLTNIVHILDMTNSKCEPVDLTGTSKNGQEARFSMEFAAILHKAGLSLPSMMMLTPCQGQYDIMKKNVHQLPGSGLSVRKVDSSQGDEADIILMSLVRDEVVGLGFMDALKRQNVATSRAREALYVVAKMALLKKSPTWISWCNGLAGVNANLTITFEGPVTWMIDDRVVAPLDEKLKNTSTDLKAYVVDRNTVPCSLPRKLTGARSPGPRHGRSDSIQSRISGTTSPPLSLSRVVSVEQRTRSGTISPPLQPLSRQTSQTQPRSRAGTATSAHSRSGSQTFPQSGLQSPASTQMQVTPSAIVENFLRSHPQLRPVVDQIRMRWREHFSYGFNPGVYEVDIAVSQLNAAAGSRVAMEALASIVRGGGA